MSIINYILSGSSFTKAKKLTLEAREEQGEKADQLFQQAYHRFSAISESFSNYSDVLHSWGFALLHQAQSKPSNEAIKIYEEAINKFSLCKSVSPAHLGAALDGGVALLGLAKSKQVGFDNELYDKVKQSFESAEKIQLGSSAYNLACLYALQNKQEACLKSLETARDFGLLPDEKNIINDDDLKNVKQLPWFTEFVASLAEEEEEEEEKTALDKNDN